VSADKMLFLRADVTFLKEKWKEHSGQKQKHVPRQGEVDGNSRLRDHR